MNRYIDRLQQEHRRLNRLIDTCHRTLGQGELKMLKRLRLKIKDRLAQVQRRRAPSGQRLGR